MIEMLSISKTKDYWASGNLRSQQLGINIMKMVEKLVNELLIKEFLIME